MFALLQTRAGELPGGYGLALLQGLLSLVGVCFLAWVVLRWSRSKGFGVSPSRGAVQVLERVYLDAHHVLYVVKAGERTLLLGAADRGAPSLLTELGTASKNASPTSTDVSSDAKGEG